MAQSLRLSKTRVRPVCRRPVRQRIRHIQEVRRVTAGTIHGTGMTIVTSGLTSGRMVTMATDGFILGDDWTDAWRERNSGFVRQHNDDNSTDAFRPVTLPGEIKSRSSKQCVGFSSGFVYTVRDQSYPTPSHHQHDPDLCIDDAMSSDLFFDDQLAHRTSGFECSFASGFDVNANSAMGKLCTGRRSSVAKTYPAMPCTRDSGVMVNLAGLLATSLIKNRSDSALICRNPWSIAPISGPQWLCATENVEDAAPS